MTDHPVAREGVPFVKATCRCGREGRTQQPEHYRCSACYYDDRATYEEEQAAKLHGRADKRTAEAQRFRGLAQKFRDQHRKEDTHAAQSPDAQERPHEGRKPRRPHPPAPRRLR